MDLLPNKQFLDRILTTREWFSNHFENLSTVCLIKQIAVTQQYQNKGIADQFIKEVLIQTNEQSDVTCCLAWRKGNNTSVKNLLIKNDFVHHITIDNYWKKDSINKKYNCAHCGLPPCNCSAEVYSKKKKD